MMKGTLGPGWQTPGVAAPRERLPLLFSLTQMFPGPKYWPSVPVDPKQGALEGPVPLGGTEKEVRGVESPGLAGEWHGGNTRA